MITKLIPTTEFVQLVQKEVRLRQSKLSEWDVEGCLNWDMSGYEQICNYVNFISQTPQLWMFVPCDENGIELKNPDSKFGGVVIQTGEIMYRVKYKEAQSKVLFSGWATDDDGIFIQNIQTDTYFHLTAFDTLEEMIMELNQSEIELELSETAIKQFEL